MASQLSETIKLDHESAISISWGAEPRSVNMVLLDTEILDAPGEGQTSEQWGNIIMIDFTAKGKILEEEIVSKEGAMDDELESCIMYSNSQMTLVEESKCLPVDPYDPIKMLQVGK